MSFAVTQSNAVDAGFAAFADDATLVTNLAVVELRAIFDAGYAAASVGQGIERQNPMASIQTADAPADLARGDTLIVGNAQYPISLVRNNSDGTTDLILGFGSERIA